MSKEEIDLTDNSLKIPSGKSLTLGPESEEKLQRSVKSIKSPVTILSGVYARSSSGMFNFDEGQGLATMEKKKEKLEQLCVVMNNRKQQIAEKEQLLGFEIGRKDDLISRIKILEEQKIAQNILDTSIAPEIKQIQKIIENNRQAQIELGQSIESISTDLKSRKTQEQQQVGVLIKQTSQVNNDISSTQKQVDVAKKRVSQQSIESDKPSPAVIELQQTISKLQLQATQGQNNLKLVQAKHDQDKKDSQLKSQTLKNKLYTSQKTKSEIEEQIQSLERQKLEQIAHLLKTQTELANTYEQKLKEIKESTSKLVIPENPIETVPVTPQQEQQLINLIKELEQKNSVINKEEIETKLKDIEVEHQKIIQINSTVKEDQHQTEAKAQEVHNLTQQVSKLEKQLKSLSEQTVKAAQKKQQSANFLIAQKNKHETALKDSEFYKIQTKIDQLKRKLHEQKGEYLRLESLNKQFVTASIIEQYKNKNKEYKEQVRKLEALKNERELLTKESEELKEQKQRIEWQENSIAVGLETSIKHLKVKLQQMAKDNKDLQKKLTQSQSKVKQYKDHYPEFEIKVEKKTTKKKGKVEDVVEPVKEVKVVKDTKDTKQTKKSKDKKKSEKKQEAKAEQSEQISQNLVQPKVQQTIIKEQQIVVQTQKAIVVSSAPKSKKQKKKTTQANDQITLMNNILNSEQQDPLLSKTESKNKKDKKDKKNNKNGKKQKQSSSKSKMQQQLQFLIQSTKDEAPSGFNFKSTPIFAGLFVLLTGSAYWLLS